MYTNLQRGGNPRTERHSYTKAKERKETGTLYVTLSSSANQSSIASLCASLILGLRRSSSCLLLEASKPPITGDDPYKKQGHFVASNMPSRIGEDHMKPA